MPNRIMTRDETQALFREMAAAVVSALDAPKRTIIIGISGRARSGKDTLAELLIAEYGNGFRMSFAAPIRQCVAEILGTTVAALEDGPLKEQPLEEFGGKSPRQMMQTLGTEWGREMIAPDIWITAARNKLLSYIGDDSVGRVVVFSDVRFENEAAMIRGLGGKVVHVVREGNAAVSAHVSENGLAPHPDDEFVENDGSLEDLRYAAAALLEALDR